MRTSKVVAWLALAMSGVGMTTAPKAEAAYIEYLYQSGSDVIATGSGSFDLQGLTYFGSASESSKIMPGLGILVTGSGNTDIYGNYSGPSNFGTGSGSFASSGSGGIVGINGLTNVLWLPAGYVSGTEVESSAVWDDETLSGVGASVGTYTWIWGSGAHADSLTLNVGEAPPPVPEPASLGLLATGLVGLGAAIKRRVRAT